MDIANENIRTELDLPIKPWHQTIYLPFRLIPGDFIIFDDILDDYKRQEIIDKYGEKIFKEAEGTWEVDSCCIAADHAGTILIARLKRPTGDLE